MNLNVKIRKMDLGKIKGFADITINDMFIVKDLKVMEGSNGLFVSMPSVKLNKPYKDKNGYDVEYQDTFFPVTREAREFLTEKVLEEFNKGNTSANNNNNGEFPF